MWSKVLSLFQQTEQVEHLISLRKKAIVSTTYLIITLVLSCFVRDIPNQYAIESATAQTIFQMSQMGDPISFMTAAIDIAESGWISPANEWILNLWPPGFILLEALVFKLFGKNTLIILALTVLASTLFSVVLSILYGFLRTKFKSRMIFLIPLLIFIFPITRIFLLQPVGLTLGESFSVGFFLIFILLAIKSAKNNSVKQTIYAGFFLALSAYFRSQFEIIVLGLTGTAVLVTAFHFYFQHKNSRSFKKTIQNNISIFIILFVAHATMLPWRIYHFVKHDNPSWVQTSTVTFRNSVMTNEHFEKNKASFVVEGGGNLVCRLEPTTCGDLANAKIAFIKTFLKHPFEWYSIKLNLLGKYWFASSSDLGSIINQPTLLENIFNAFSLLCLIALLILLFLKKVRSDQSWIYLVWISSALFASYFLIFTVQQFEARYFYFPKIVGFFIFSITISVYLSSMSKRNEKYEHRYVSNIF